MTKYVKILKLNKMTSEQKERLYNRLLNNYNWICKLDIFIDGNYYCTPEIIFYNKDLCVSHFGKNFYYRTQKAVNTQRYKNFGNAISELKKLIKNHYSGNVTTSDLRVYYRYKCNMDKKNVFNIEL